MSSEKDLRDSSRYDRIDINILCILKPWGIKANLENMSLSGAFFDCENFPDDLLHATIGELHVGNLKLPGKFIRVNKLKVAIEFTPFDSSVKKQVEAFLDMFKK